MRRRLHRRQTIHMDSGSEQKCKRIPPSVNRWLLYLNSAFDDKFSCQWGKPTLSLLCPARRYHKSRISIPIVPIHWHRSSRLLWLKSLMAQNLLWTGLCETLSWHRPACRKLVGSHTRGRAYQSLHLLQLLAWCNSWSVLNKAFIRNLCYQKGQTKFPTAWVKGVTLFDRFQGRKNGESVLRISQVLKTRTLLDLSFWLNSKFKATNPKVLHNFGNFGSTM